MPAIESLLASKFENFRQAKLVTPNPAPVHLPARRNPFLRCPMPPLAPVSVDNLEQFDLHGLIPQYRVLR